MMYFLTVQPFHTTTKLGLRLANLVLHRYNNTLVSYKEANGIPQYLADEIATLCKLNKHMKPMVVHTRGFSDGNLIANAPAEIYVAKESEAGRAFTINLLPVWKDYTRKGGRQ